MIDPKKAMGARIPSRVFTVVSGALVLALSLCLVPNCQGQVASSGFDEKTELQLLPSYVPETQVSGVIRNFGNNYIPDLMNRWEEGFRRFQPSVRFETNLPGSEAAMAGLYGGIADLAFIGRESYDAETRAFTETVGYPPLGIEISSGSFMTPHKTFALMVFVHKDNPLTRMKISELARVFGCPPQPSEKPIQEWGDLGLEGAWKHRAIHVYGYSPTTGMARYFQRFVLGKRGRWSDRVIDFDNGHQPNGEVINAGRYILEALAKDPAGVAFANFLYAGPEVRAIALAGARDAGFSSPTFDNVFHRKYPLTRFTSVFLDRPPGKPVNRATREFLRYILSRDGMEAVVADGAYVPLNADQIAIEREKLD
jgi:phosphate transport system substrate-binding protein